MREWRWVGVDVALAAHGEQLAEHGGAAGVRDMNMLESAMARPLNLVAYGDPDAAELAASYAFGIARNHPFVDGNKRTAAVVGETFLALNNHALTCDDVELATIFLQLAAGDLTVEQLAGWFRRWTFASMPSESDIEVLAAAEQIVCEDRDVLRDLA